MLIISHSAVIDADHSGRLDDQHYMSHDDHPDGTAGLGGKDPDLIAG